MWVLHDLWVIGTNIVSNEKGILHVLNVLEGSLHILLQHLVTFLFSTQFVCKTRGRHTRRLKFQNRLILSKKTFWITFTLKKNYLKKSSNKHNTFKSVHFLLQFLHGSLSKFSTGLGLKIVHICVKCRKLKFNKSLGKTFLSKSIFYLLVFGSEVPDLFRICFLLL